MKGYLKVLLKIVVSSLLIYFVFKGEDTTSFISNLKQFSPIYILLVVLTIALNYFISSVRWKALLIHKDGEKITIPYLTSLYFVGSFFNNFMPTSIGGDVYKVYKLGKKMKNMSDAFAATFMERFTGVLSLMIISFVSLYKYLGYGALLMIVWVLLSVVIGLKILQFFSKKHEKLGKIYNSFKTYEGKNKVLLTALATSFLVQILSVLSQYFIFRGLGQNVSLFYSFAVLPMITLAGFFIPSLNGIGVQDVLYKELFVFAGVKPEISLSASLLYHFFRLGVSLIGGVLYAVDKDK
jgi:uncharacterized membrane protein YbhN (UPF0104 family)